MRSNSSSSSLSAQTPNASPQQRQETTLLVTTLKEANSPQAVYESASKIVAFVKPKENYPNPSEPSLFANSNESEDSTTNNNNTAIITVEAKHFTTVVFREACLSAFHYATTPESVSALAQAIFYIACRDERGNKNFPSHAIRDAMILALSKYTTMMTTSSSSSSGCSLEWICKAIHNIAAYSSKGKFLFTTIELRDALLTAFHRCCKLEGNSPSCSDTVESVAVLLATIATTKEGKALLATPEIRDLLITCLERFATTPTCLLWTAGAINNITFNPNAIKLFATERMRDAFAKSLKYATTDPAVHWCCKAIGNILECDDRVMRRTFASSLSLQSAINNLFRATKSREVKKNCEEVLRMIQESLKVGDDEEVATTTMLVIADDDIGLEAQQGNNNNNTTTSSPKNVNNQRNKNAVSVAQRIMRDGSDSTQLPSDGENSRYASSNKLLMNSSSNNNLPNMVSSSSSPLNYYQTQQQLQLQQLQQQQEDYERLVLQQSQPHQQQERRFSNSSNKSEGQHQTFVSNLVQQRLLVLSSNFSGSSPTATSNSSSKLNNSRRASIANAMTDDQISKALQKSELTQDHCDENTLFQEMVYAAQRIQRAARRAIFYRNVVVPLVQEHRLLKLAANKRRNVIIVTLTPKNLTESPSLETASKQKSDKDKDHHHHHNNTNSTSEVVASSHFFASGSIPSNQKFYSTNPELAKLDERVESMLHEQNWAAYILGRSWRSVLSKRRGHETAVAMQFATSDNNGKKKNANNRAALLKRRDEGQIPLETTGRDALALAYVFEFAINEDSKRQHCSLLAIEAFREHTKLTHLVKERRLQKQQEKEIEKLKGPMAALKEQEKHLKAFGKKRNDSRSQSPNQQQQQGQQSPDSITTHGSFRAFGSFTFKNQDTLDVWKSYNETTTYRYRFLWGLHALYDTIITHRPRSKIGQLLLAGDQNKISAPVSSIIKNRGGRNVGNFVPKNSDGAYVPRWGATFRECLSLATISLAGSSEDQKPPTKEMVCFKSLQEQEEMEEEEKMRQEVERRHTREVKSKTTKQRLLTLRKSYDQIRANSHALVVLDEDLARQQKFEQIDDDEQIRRMMLLEEAQQQQHEQIYIAATPHNNNHHNNNSSESPSSSGLPLSKPVSNIEFDGSLPRLHHQNGTTGGGASSTVLSHHHLSPSAFNNNNNINNVSSSPQRNFGEHEHSWIEEQKKLDFLDEEEEDETPSPNQNTRANTQDQSSNSYYNQQQENDDDIYDDDDYCSFDQSTNADSPVTQLVNSKGQRQRNSSTRGQGNVVQDDGGGIDFGGDEVGWQQQHQQQQRSRLMPIHVQQQKPHHHRTQIELTAHQMKNQENRKNDLFFRKQQLEQRMLKQIMSNKEFLATDDQQQQQAKTRPTTNSTKSKSKSPTETRALSNNNNFGETIVMKNQQQKSHHPMSLSPLPDDPQKRSSTNNRKNTSSLSPNYQAPKAPATLEDMLRKKTINPLAVMDALPSADVKIATKFHVCRQELIENLGRIGGLGGKASGSTFHFTSSKEHQKKKRLEALDRQRLMQRKNRQQQRFSDDEQIDFGQTVGNYYCAATPEPLNTNLTINEGVIQNQPPPPQTPSPTMMTTKKKILVKKAKTKAAVNSDQDDQQQQQGGSVARLRHVVAQSTSASP